MLPTPAVGFSSIQDQALAKAFPVEKTYPESKIRFSVMVRLDSPKLRDQIALCASFPAEIMFLDIETTGLSHYYDEITVVGWSFGGRASTLVKGGDPELLLAEAASAKALVTFNGIRFDARFLRQEFPGIVLPETHIDLMYLCRRVGLKGGQKAIEKELGIELRTGIGDVDGFAAVLLWHRYLRGDVSALETLIRYNRADIAAMGAILDETLKYFTIDPDLFGAPVNYLSWSAPTDWLEIPTDLEPASEKLTRAPQFDELFGNSIGSNARIVGIDLTGSEARGSGWCNLVGSDAETAVVHTDEDLIGRTVAAAPHLVSIDSPLCLPFGRIAVEDSDPGREEFGIMRWCERELKRRGVNVYPCLLPSMQKLTARGIYLANILREKGIPVIESYPGAAQDIMRIPRKGAGVEWLKLGLAGFGVTGSYLEDEVTHDELDAITSALVGTFHLANMSEALGTNEEDPLVIPEIGDGEGPVVIGISGPIAAGKTTMAESFEARGFSYTRFSLVIDDMLEKQGLKLTRENRQTFGAEINRTGRQRWLAEKTIDRTLNSDRIVIDGLRFPEDHAFFVERFGGRFRHVFVDSQEVNRRNRYLEREANEAFDVVVKSEVEDRVMELRDLSHEVFVNDADISAIDRRVEAIDQRLNEGELCLFLS